MDRFAEDPLLRLLPPAEEWPHDFSGLPSEEQRWRAKYFLMTWILTRHVWLAWDAALVRDPSSVGQARRLASTIDDARIIVEVRALLAAGIRP